MPNGAAIITGIMAGIIGITGIIATTANKFLRSPLDPHCPAAPWIQAGLRQ